MASMNLAILIGHLGADPEIKNVNGQDVCKFSLATSEAYTKDNKKYEQTEWHKITVFGKTASYCGQYLRKGSKVSVQGKLKTHKWEKDGITRYSTEIVGFQVLFLDSKDSKADSNLPKLPPKEVEAAFKPTEEPIDYENIPF